MRRTTAMSDKTRFYRLISATAPPCIPAPSGIIAWWPGDGNANDIIGTNNGTLEGGVTFAPGAVGQAFSLNGSNAYVQVPQNNLWAFGTNDFSIECWAKFNANQSATLIWTPKEAVSIPNGILRMPTINFISIMPLPILGISRYRLHLRLFLDFGITWRLLEVEMCGQFSLMALLLQPEPIPPRCRQA